MKRDTKVWIAWKMPDGSHKVRRAVFQNYEDEEAVVRMDGDERRVPSWMAFHSRDIADRVAHRLNDGEEIDFAELQKADVRVGSVIDKE